LTPVAMLDRYCTKEQQADAANRAVDTACSGLSFLGKHHLAELSAERHKRLQPYMKEAH
jgi:hypothetical protein